MEITLEQIDLLRKRANVGYKEAKEALEKCGGNIVEALAFLEEENKLKPERNCCGQSSFFQKTKNIFGKINRIGFIISRDEKTIVNVPLTIPLLLTILALPLTVALLLLALFTGCKIRFRNSSGEECSINKNIENITDTVNNFTSKMAQEIKKA
ncbi:N-terminal fragment of elongation factor Ts [Desulfocucumis palustris]|uniref:N-terminal of elongation factor Ts n=1 Tax=Desulfocucumis palustris TaxID=1898651 RepID=A0A2L2X8E8_9FIRM|nr:DUF4342 domain-containing protein [Desulfocucumis palustris]GBF32378.1 N-terminal fragment of elongation factor Ts [Desulfocucumis palustris]